MWRGLVFRKVFCFLFIVFCLGFTISCRVICTFIFLLIFIENIFVRAVKLYGASLHRPLVLNIIGELYLRFA